MQVYDIPIDESRKESTLHGSYEFPLAVYETRLDRNVLGFVNWHWHEEIQFCIVTKGCVLFHVNSGTYLIRKGQGIFINSGCIHMAKPEGDLGSSYICIDADVKIISSFQCSAIEQKYILPYLASPKLTAVTLSFEKRWQVDVLDRLRRIYSLYNEEEYGYEIDISYELAFAWKGMISNIISAATEEGKSIHTDYQKMKTILSYIHENYSREITLEDISKNVHLSRSECCRFFKRSANSTLFKYIMNYRIKKSIELLHQSDMTITRIAYETGFGSVSYFVDSFRKQTACTPKEYRTKYLESNLLRVEDNC